MKRFLRLFLAAALLISAESTFAYRYVGGPGSVAIYKIGNRFHTSATIGPWQGLGAMRYYSIYVANKPPVNGRLFPIFEVKVGNWKTSCVIYGLAPGDYYCVVTPGGLYGRWNGAQHFVSRTLPK
jgi:hypothetical protein